MIGYTFKTTKISIAKIGMKNEIRQNVTSKPVWTKQSSIFLMEEFQEQLILLCQQKKNSVYFKYTMSLKWLGFRRFHFVKFYENFFAKKSGHLKFFQNESDLTILKVVNVIQFDAIIFIFVSLKIHGPSF